MTRRPRPKLDPQVTLVDRLWVVAIVVVAFADVLFLQLSSFFD